MCLLCVTWMFNYLISKPFPPTMIFFLKLFSELILKLPDLSSIQLFSLPVSLIEFGFRLLQQESFKPSLISSLNLSKKHVYWDIIWLPWSDRSHSLLDGFYSYDHLRLGLFGISLHTFHKHNSTTPVLDKMTSWYGLSCLMSWGNMNHLHWPLCMAFYPWGFLYPRNQYTNLQRPQNPLTPSGMWLIIWELEQ